MSECKHCCKKHDENSTGEGDLKPIIEAAKKAVKELDKDAKIAIIAVEKGDVHHSLIQTDGDGMIAFLDGLLDDDDTYELVKVVLMKKMLERIKNS